MRDFIELITVHPGALVYHLVTLFAIQLIAGVALGHWQRRRDEAAARLLVTGVGLFLARAVLMLMAVLDAVGLVASAAVFPPLERFLDLGTSLLVVWAFLPVLEENRRLSTQLLLVTTLVAAGAYAAFASLWPAAESQGVVYNGYWQERVWELSTTAILGVAFVASLVWRRGDWGWLACLLALWLVGHVLQLVSPTPLANTAGWVRLTGLAALPLLAALIYRQALEAPGIRPVVDRPVPEDTARVPEPPRPLVREREDAHDGTAGVLEAFQRIKAEGNLRSGLEPAAPAIARTMSADMAAVALLVPGPMEVLRVIALHPATSVIAAKQEPTLLLSRHPLLAAACRSGHLERAGGDRRPSLVDGLYRRLGFPGSGPLLAQPLVADDEVLGLILVGNPESQRAWNTRDEQVLETMADLLASAAAGDGKGETVPDELWARAREETERMASRAEDLEAALQRERRRSEELSTKLRLKEKEAGEQERSPEAVAVWQEEIRQLSEARDELEAKLSQRQKEADRLGEAKKELEEQLDQARTAAPQPVDRVLGGVLVSDEEGAVILASRNTHRLLETSRAELMDARFQDLFDEPWWNRTVDRLLKRSSQPGDVTAVSLNLGEQIVRAELTRLPLSEQWPGTLVALLFAAERPTVEREMVASLIQEFRTPLTSITGYTDLLLSEQSGILGESQLRLLLRVEANVERMEGLINDLIKATDLDTGQVALLPEPVRMDDVIAAAIDVLSPRLDERDLEVELDSPPALPPVRADRDSLEQIVLNLLSNAAHASQPGTQIGLRVRVEGQPDDVEGVPAYLLVSVTDTGGGIAPVDQRRVFHRFYRADNPLIPGVGETGVGLSVAKTLVEANAGRIWVESEMGTGSTFSFLLPLSRPD